MPSGPSAHPLASSARPGPATAARAPSPVVRAAALAAAAALGVLVGLGLRGVGSDGLATALARLAVVALRLRGLPEFVTPDRDGGLAALAGGLHVAVIAAGWGAVLGMARERLAAPGARRWLAAATVIAVVLALAALDTVLPAPLRLAAGTLTGAEWALLVAAVALAAAFGAHSAGLVTRP